MTDSSSHSAYIFATGTEVECRPRITANSRSMAWAEGSSLATGPGLARIT